MLSVVMIMKEMQRGLPELSAEFHPLNAHELDLARKQAEVKPKTSGGKPRLAWRNVCWRMLLLCSKGAVFLATRPCVQSVVSQSNLF